MDNPKNKGFSSISEASEKNNVKPMRSTCLIVQGFFWGFVFVILNLATGGASDPLALVLFSCIYSFFEPILDPDTSKLLAVFGMWANICDKNIMIIRSQCCFCSNCLKESASEARNIYLFRILCLTFLLSINLPQLHTLPH